MCPSLCISDGARSLILGSFREPEDQLLDEGMAYSYSLRSSAVCMGAVLPGNTLSSLKCYLNSDNLNLQIWLTCCIVGVSSITFFGKRKFARVAAVGRKPTAITRELRSNISLAEVSQYTTENDFWLVVNGIVIDYTKFLENHPAVPL